MYEILFLLAGRYCCHQQVVYSLNFIGLVYSDIYALYSTFLVVTGELIHKQPRVHIQTVYYLCIIN